MAVYTLLRSDRRALPVRSLARENCPETGLVPDDARVSKSDCPAVFGLVFGEAGPPPQRMVRDEVIPETKSCARLN